MGWMRSPLDARPPAPDFGRVGPEHASPFVAIMAVLHSEPIAPAYTRLLRKRLEPQDSVLLAHLFEEISVLALHHLVPEALLFDAFAFDLYWDELREDVLTVRRETANEKFCENFEIAAERAREYRNDRPPKLRWRHRPSGPDEPPPGPDRRPPEPPRPAPVERSGQRRTREPARRR